jgi:hypothetical protein
VFLLFSDCLSHFLFMVSLLVVWFAYATGPSLMLLIVPVRVQDSLYMGLGPVSWGLSFPAGVGLIVVLLVVVWPGASDMPFYDGFLDVYVFCM